MKTTLIALMISLSLNAFADQKILPMTNTSLHLEGDSFIAQGDVKRKTYEGKIHQVWIRGTVAGKICGSSNCSGKLSVEGNDLIINASIDSSNTGNIDGREKKIVGQLVGDLVDLEVPAEFHYVIQRYSWAERMLGLKNSEWISLAFHL